jgi:hypothetical protein
MLLVASKYQTGSGRTPVLQSGLPGRSEILNLLKVMIKMLRIRFLPLGWHAIRLIGTQRTILKY